MRPEPNSPTLVVNDISFTYHGRDVEAVSDFSLSVKPGELVGLLGPNGAGKSTVLRMMAGLISPSKGSVEAMGINPAIVPRKVAAKAVAFVPASLGVHFPMTVRDFVALGRTAHLRGLFESTHDKKIVADALEFTKITHLANRGYNELSAGEQRRVLVARAIAQEPHVLLLDEPTANLDIAHAVSLLGRISALAKTSGTAIVAAIHDLNIALLFCDRLILLQNGHTVALGLPEAVMQYSTVKKTFGCDVYIGRNEINGRLFVVPMDAPLNE
ncbi:MAG: ABC transporter ATP-binding protein [Myxococcota bacterium]|jgi:iron complex transport system ATP-binding protein|nr:ABC transporter ATP-binding protein [Myxococcota bacterium]MBP8971017.1 ABC transporter ATP-binding protein [Myxococcota bacterium]HHW96319.1 ABC transporter ATP-binding protein [Oligoflexales bacterium]HQC44258.1 ABC transporter ATP-binding protein [Myxococcota bacterium]HQL57300.1 ABC transporter ATP-binding protein [Myxococcota bacterium]